MSLSFQAANQKKMNILVSDTVEISLNMKYFGGLSRSLQLLQLASLPVTGCRLSRYARVGFLKRPVRNRAAQLYFYSYSPCVCKCMQECFSKETPLSQLRAACYWGALMVLQCGSQHPGPCASKCFLEGWLHAEYFRTALYMFPPPLSHSSGMAHAEDARSVV